MVVLFKGRKRFFYNVKQASRLAFIDCFPPRISLSSTLAYLHLIPQGFILSNKLVFLLLKKITKSSQSHILLISKFINRPLFHEEL